MHARLAWRMTLGTSLSSVHSQTATAATETGQEQYWHRVHRSLVRGANAQASGASDIYVGLMDAAWDAYNQITKTPHTCHSRAPKRPIGAKELGPRRIFLSQTKPLAQHTCSEAVCNPLHALQMHDTPALSQACTAQHSAC